MSIFNIVLCWEHNHLLTIHNLTTQWWKQCSQITVSAQQMLTNTVHHSPDTHAYPNGVDNQVLGSYWFGCSVQLYLPTGWSTDWPPCIQLFIINYGPLHPSCVQITSHQRVKTVELYSFGKLKYCGRMDIIVFWSRKSDGNDVKSFHLWQYRPTAYCLVPSASTYNIVLDVVDWGGYYDV